MYIELTDKSFSFTKRSCENDSSPLKIPQTENDSIDASDSIMDNVSEIMIKYKFLKFCIEFRNTYNFRPFPNKVWSHKDFLDLHGRLLDCLHIGDQIAMFS